MTRDDFAFRAPIRVRYSEIDAQGIVFNAHYLTYFDVAITEYLRFLGHPSSARAPGLEFHLVKSLVEYRRPIVKDSLIEVGVVCGRIGTTSVTWSLAIFGRDAGDDDDHALLASGEIVWVCSRTGEHRSHPLPPAFVALLRAEGDHPAKDLR